MALFSPLPPSKSGIADYSEALAAELQRCARLTVFGEMPPAYSRDDFDIAVYQLGNNPWHGFVYGMALRHPGIVVMHEGNLHHLIADLTIGRGDWDGYVAECEYNGGAAALAHARRVRALEAGPDYDGLPMTRRVLEASRGVIVHSEFVARQMREQGFAGPVAVIPHGASVPRTDRNGVRHLLGLDATTPLIGAFGYLKPYKRIAESLRALRRLVAVDPRARMILVGEPHPEFPVQQLVRTLGLAEYVRIFGFVPIEKFVDYIGACDIVLNLRYPTVGETSGSLQRALGLGKAVIVSDVGSFSELPDEICLKVPAGPGLGAQEEDLIFEYLNLLVSRPELARAMGGRARAWVERECSWERAAERYAEFIDEVLTGRKPAAADPVPVRKEPAARADDLSPEPEVLVPEVLVPKAASQEAAAPEAIVPEAKAIDEKAVEELVAPWVVEPAQGYYEQHVSRLARTLDMIPAGDASQAVLEMGVYLQITPALKSRFGYGYVRGCYFGKAGVVESRRVTSDVGEVFECEVDLFDAERDPYPYADESFNTVLCCELLEHLASDPMHMMREINRILKPGGHLLVTTPNICSLRALSAIMQGYHPSFFPAYILPRKEGEEAEARHNREYAPMEIRALFRDAGFAVQRLETGEFLEEPHPEFGWIEQMLGSYRLPVELRGDGIYALGRKTGPVKERWPKWLYQ